MAPAFVAGFPSLSPCKTLERSVRKPFAEAFAAFANRSFKA